MIKELEDLVKDLNTYLEAKKTELEETDCLDLKTYEAIDIIREKAIENFKLACNNSETNPKYINQVIENFKNDAKVIKSAIDRFICNKAI